VNTFQNFIIECKEKVLSGLRIQEDETKRLINVPDNELRNLAQAANEITRKFNGLKVDIEQLNNIKKSGCSEDCAFCAQSAFYDTGIDRYHLPPTAQIVRQAQKAKNEGAESYCLVAAWRKPSRSDFEKVCEIIDQINKKIGIKIDCSLGFLTPYQAKKLKELRVHRYNHNLETARSKFPDICTTHTYDDRLNTLKIAREVGLQICTGGIFGMGETREQRLELILDIAKIQPEEVTINILVPVKGTPLELQPPLSYSEIVRVFAVLRFLLPHSIIKISGGREINLEDGGKDLLQSGANGIITGGYLTIGGNEAQQDLLMIKKIGLQA
jgi:biotin synthase